MTVDHSAVSDTVFVRGLEARSVIGVHSWERRLPQRLCIDLAMGVDTRPAATSDDIARAVDYAAVAEATRTFVEESQYRLIEALAGNLADHLLAQFGIARIEVTLTKPGALSGATGVGVTLTRAQPQLP